VPLPAGARPARGSDGDLVVWQPSSDRLWEFWRLRHGAAGWQASWGGAMQRASTDAGVYARDVWPGAKPWWGVTASSLSLVGGLISLADLRSGHIDHALSLSIPDTRAGVYALPAQRTDGTSAGPDALPEGAHLRLDPTLDLPALHLPALTLMLAQAAQRYGLYITDTSPNIAFDAQDPTSASDPYTAPGGYFGGTNPRRLLARFPWSRLQVLAAPTRRR
jgi:hypothetical protein